MKTCNVQAFLILIRGAMKKLTRAEKGRFLSVVVPHELYDILSRVCLMRKITKTEAIVKYLRWIEATEWRKRKFIDEKYEGTPFSLDG